jgi:ComEC/Rec2-related protein
LKGKLYIPLRVSGLEVKLNKKIYLLFFILLIFTQFYSYPQNNNISEIEGIVISSKEKPFKSEILLRVEKLTINGKSYNWNGKIIVVTREKIKILNYEKIKIKNPVINRIQEPRNPFEFDYVKFLKRNGIFFLVRADNIEIIETRRNILLLFSKLRDLIEKKIEKYMKFNKDGAELVKLITIGSDDVSYFLKELGVKTGIYHLFVISGLHIIFLIFFLKVIFIPFQKINNIRPKFFPIMLLSFLLFYNFLCGFKIPVTRAVMMVSFYIIFEIFDRYIEPLNSIILTAILFLIFNPSNIYSTSFYLSFLSTTGILIMYKKINLIKKRRFLINNFSATISAQIFILPVLFYNFGYFYPIGILTNLIFTQIVGAIMILSFISLLFPVFFILLNFMTDYFLKLLNLISNFSPSINIYFPLPFVFVYYFLLFLFLSGIKINKKFIITGLTVISLVPFYFKKSDKKEIIFYSSKNPLILINWKNRGVLIISDKIENPENYRDIIYKFTKSEKIKIEKIIIINGGFSDNIFFASKFSKEIYLSESINFPYIPYKNLKRFVENEKIDFYDLEFILKDGNLIIKDASIKILIFLKENIESFNLNDRYFLIYLAKFKKNKKNEEKINNLKPLYLLLCKNLKKFENLKSLCQNYYLEKSAVILNLKTKEIEYYRK